jgi:serine/threonine protein kinase
MNLPTPPMVITIGSCICDEARGQHAHRYTIQHQIGSGGMGAVFKAVDHDPPQWYRDEHGDAERFVAIKYLNPDMLTRKSSQEERETRARFQREAETACQIDHENVVGVFNYGEDHERRPLIVMEYVAHANLLSDVIAAARDRYESGVRRHPTTRKVHGTLLAPETLFQILKQLLSALEELHRHGLVHRDLKPDNCLLTGETLRLTDFGIVKILETQQKLQAHVLTAEGMLMGTPYYMSPEQTGSPVYQIPTKKFWSVDVYSDIWAFGVITYEMVSGALPFDGENPYEIVSLIRDKDVPPRPLSEVVTDLPRGLERLITACLQYNPWDRPQTVKDVRELVEAAEQEFRRASASVTLSSKPPPADESDREMIVSSVRRVDTMLPPPQETRVRTFAGIAIVLGIAFIMAMAWIVTRDMTPTGPSRTQALSQAPSAKSADAIVAPPPARPVAQAVPVAPVASKRTPEAGPAPKSDADVLYQKGIHAFNQRDCRTAESAMRRVIAVHPAYPKPYLTLAQCALRKGERERARENVASYLSFEGVDPLPAELLPLVP